ncbi:sugar ABC transporter ATP-binding protein [Mesobacillus sp. AQ2]|uniref:sugar ABC transporter ATP-binding protein n=1 Tax=unclassified Mesobacillus TaxID=2675270 RepID=UPI00203F3C2F|nr:MULTISPECIES: sugar ABC transporter ATP-binding protein [unclassified Mesobacillus]MCM3124589.1 sugar ABC transporter ATP-binding protein [Mesobacillus sp. MER 33]MCM3234701.1 sugar ABC transporter ATP-binding protein [Mesobacillus sp. MER 48]WHX41634.1 sugar ABC transporter ATP-binding protein [Mesobacillus sp. AQ2]
MILEMKNISIEFPGVRALNGVDFNTETGRIHALIGANGAGKSTLMKVLSGAHDHYTGEIQFDGEYAEIRKPAHAQKLGIQTVYQEVDTAIIPSLTVGENIMLNQTVQNLDNRHWMNWKQLFQQAEDILKGMNLKLPVKKLAGELTLAEKQLVLIARAISSNCSFLILDEPTAPLSHIETSELFRIVRDLARRNVGIIFISHRMPEIFELCDELTIMRNGEFIAKRETAEVDPPQVIEYMLGRRMEDQFPARSNTFGNQLLEVAGLSDGDKVRNTSFHVNAGEIVGIAGLVGAGKTELCKALFGASQTVSGTVRLNGKELKLTSPHAAVKSGMALVPEERRKEGVLVAESVSSNLTAVSLKKFSKLFGFIDRRSEKNTAQEYIKALGIKTPSESAKVENLSGGNQQKVAIGRWLLADADVYIFDEPTKGVDVGAKRDIFELIAKLAAEGKGIIYASSELSEIVGITDRVYVLYDGEPVKELETAETTEEELLFYSTGGR